jgi:hypothetical protein
MSLTYSLSPSGQNIVANLSLYNPVDNNEKIPAVLDVALEKPIVNRDKDYKMTILRFQCPLTSVQPTFNLNGKTIEVIIRNNAVSKSESRTLIGSVHFIGEFVGIVNEMLKSCHQQLGDGKPPYIFFQPENRLFYLVVPELYIQFSEDLLIFMNETLYTYFSGFPSSN